MIETLRAWWQEAYAFLVPRLTAAYRWVVDLVSRLEPRTLWIGALALALLLLALWLLSRRRAPRAHPEVLLSLGTISPSEGDDPSVMRPARHLLKVTVSNLNPFAVQVLEVALKTPEMDAPQAAEVAAVVPPEGSVMVSAHVAELTGDEGRLNVYFFASGRRRTYRVQATFSYEPWNSRYKISPLGQTLAPAKRLASSDITRLDEQLWREQAESGSADEPRQPVLVPAPRDPQPRPAPRRVASTSHHVTQVKDPLVVTAEPDKAPAPDVSPKRNPAPRRVANRFPDEF